MITSYCGKFVKMVATASFGFGLWQVVAYVVQNLRGIPFPSPLDCAGSLLDLLSGTLLLDYTIYEHTYASCLRWLTAFFFAYVSAMLYAFCAFWFSFFRALSMPTVEVLQLVPGLAWIPVVILLFGLGSEATFSIIVLTTFPVLAIAAYNGFVSVDIDYVRVGRMCGYGFWRIFVSIYIPAALSHILSGTRIAIGTSWRVLVAAEMVVGSGKGLGYAIIQSRWTMDYSSTFACIVIIALIGLTLERLVFLPLERYTLKCWRVEDEK